MRVSTAIPGGKAAGNTNSAAAVSRPLKRLVGRSGYEIYVLLINFQTDTKIPIPVSASNIRAIGPNTGHNLSRKSVNLFSPNFLVKRLLQWRILFAKIASTKHNIAEAIRKKMVVFIVLSLLANRGADPHRGQYIQASLACTVRGVGTRFLTNSAPRFPAAKPPGTTRVTCRCEAPAEQRSSAPACSLFIHNFELLRLELFDFEPLDNLIMLIIGCN